MKRILFAMLAIAATFSYGQSKEEKEVVAEGTKLYKTDMASWYGTDIFLARFNDRRQNTGGYFSYLSDEKAVCVFVSRGDKPKIIGTFTFDSTYDVNTAIVDGTERELTQHELDLLTIRQSALTEYQTDTLFKSYKDMNPNFIPVIDQHGKRVYILTGPQKQGVVVFGNDYLLTYDNDNKLMAKKRLHRNIIVEEYGSEGGKVVVGAMHTHSRETGDLITATDLCTLMLYEKYTQWGQYIVISKNNVSLWDCKKHQLLVMTTEAWKKISDSQNKKKK
ncbi:MAG: hypothetical protein QM762_18020 [Chryseolinea sp.]